MPTFIRLKPQRIPRRGGRAWKNQKQQAAVMAALRAQGGGTKTPLGTSSTTGEVYGVGRGRAFRKTGVERQAFLESLAPAKLSRYLAGEGTAILRAQKKLSEAEQHTLNQQLRGQHETNQYRPVTGAVVSPPAPASHRELAIAAGIVGVGLAGAAIMHPGLLRWVGRKLGGVRSPLAAARGITKVARRNTTWETKQAGFRLNRALTQRAHGRVQAAADWLTGTVPGEAIAGPRAVRVGFEEALKEHQGNQLNEFMHEVPGLSETESGFGYQPGAIDRADRWVKRLFRPAFRKFGVEYDPDYMYRFGRQGRLPSFAAQVEEDAAKLMTAKPEKYVSGGNKSRSVVELGPNASKAALARSLESLRHGEGGWALGGGTRQTQGFVHALKPGEVRKVRRASDVSLTHGVSGPEVLLDPKGYVRRRRRLVLPTSPAHPELRAPQTDILGRPYGTYVPAGPVKNHRRSFVEIYRELRSEGIDHGRAMQMASERAK